jgi:hypothetical protein
MDFAANRTAMRPQYAIRRQQAGVRHDLVEIFRNRQRVPYGGALVAQARHQDGRSRISARAEASSELIGALGMLGSQQAGERAAAALQVERLRARLGKQ